MNMSEAIKIAVVTECDKRKMGIVALSNFCRLSYEKTVRIWKGDGSAKIVHAMTVLESLDLPLSEVFKDVT